MFFMTLCFIYFLTLFAIVEQKLSSTETPNNFHISEYQGGLVNIAIGNVSFRSLKFFVSDEEIPVYFDAREKWTYCKSLRRIYHQGKCGSCWAIASVSVMSDKLCIRTEGKNQFEFSAEDAVTCCKFCTNRGRNGCGGGDPYLAMEFWRKKGIVSGGGYKTRTGCKPYADKTFKGKAILCLKRCTTYSMKKYSKDKRYGVESYVIDPTGNKEVQYEIMHNGPVVVGILDLYDDFKTYTKGVYIRKVDEKDKLGHAVKLIGWGVDDGVPYWLGANSWGTKWGEKGFFKFLRGENHCRIEKFAVSGEPLLSIAVPRRWNFWLFLVCLMVPFLTI